LESQNRNVDPDRIDDTQQESPDISRIKKAVLNDIQRANNFYNAKVEPTLRIRHQIYEADKSYYKESNKEACQEKR